MSAWYIDISEKLAIIYDSVFWIQNPNNGGYLMKIYMKKIALCVFAVLLTMTSTSAMQRLDQAGESAISYIANSLPWTKFCDFLIQTGQDVASCKSYQGDTCQPISLDLISNMSNVSRTTFVLFGILELLGQSTAITQAISHSTNGDHPIIEAREEHSIGDLKFDKQQGWGIEVDTIGSILTKIHNSLIDVTCSGLDSLGIVECTTQNNQRQQQQQQLEIFIMEPLNQTLQELEQEYLEEKDDRLQLCKPNPHQKNHQHNVIVSISQDREIECSIYPDFTITCCSPNSDSNSTCVSGNPLDNHKPFLHCCIINTSNQAECSHDVCSDANASHPAFFTTIKQLENPSQYVVTILKEIDALNKEMLRKLGDFSALKTLQNLVKRFEAKFSLLKPFSVKRVQIGGEISAWTSGDFTHGENVELGLGDVYLSKDNHISRNTIDLTIGHEIAHRAQGQAKQCCESYQECYDPLHQNTRCLHACLVHEIGADLHGALVSYSSSADRRPILFAHHFIATVGGIERLDEYKEFIAHYDFLKDIPDINKTNVHTVRNLGPNWNPAAPHPDSLVRATMFAKLDTILDAIIKHFS